MPVGEREGAGGVGARSARALRVLVAPFVGAARGGAARACPHQRWAAAAVDTASPHMLRHPASHVLFSLRLRAVQRGPREHRPVPHLDFQHPAKVYDAALRVRAERSEWCRSGRRFPNWLVQPRHSNDEVAQERGRGLALTLASPPFGTAMVPGSDWASCLCSGSQGVQGPLRPVSGEGTLNTGGRIGAFASPRSARLDRRCGTPEVSSPWTSVDEDHLAGGRASAGDPDVIWTQSWFLARGSGGDTTIDR